MLITIEGYLHKAAPHATAPTRSSQQPFRRSSGAPEAESARPTIPPQRLLAGGPEKPIRTRPDCLNLKKMGRYQQVPDVPGTPAEGIDGPYRNASINRHHRSSALGALPGEPVQDE